MSTQPTHTHNDPQHASQHDARDAAHVNVQNVSFRYPGGVNAITDLSLQIAYGESIALVGSNGAGKSTLLTLLNGCILPTVGTLRIGDIPITQTTLREIRRVVGTVFADADDQLFMPTVGEDVAFGPTQRGLPADDVERRVVSALEQVGMLHLRERAPYRLSSGEKRAVAIATVLAMTPELLLMDEPSSSLDPRGRRRLIDWLKTFPNTKIIATHDLELAVEVCPRVVILDGGKIVADGPTHHLLDDETLMLTHGLERPHILRHSHPHR